MKKSNNGVLVMIVMVLLVIGCCLLALADQDSAGDKLAEFGLCGGDMDVMDGMDTMDDSGTRAGDTGAILEILNDKNQG